MPLSVENCCDVGVLGSFSDINACYIVLILTSPFSGKIFSMDNEFEDIHAVSDMIPSNQQKKKQWFIQKILTMKERNGKTMSTRRGSVDSSGEIHGNSFWLCI
ncbi:hypothetical protein Lalb_Chr03g0032461 [Lupinus albus]|uniref:Uncharacterized protein n=1 Tax=Lupinus albus TaxID=3870 RepID=A0A6A4QS69_LUPAL|nr:hypothetical protein Lalb_Chr03g0032461 [Lupinus albus]